MAESVLDMALGWFRKAVPIVVLGGIVAVVLSIIFALIAGLVPAGADIISLIIAMLIIIVTGGMLKKSDKKMLENIPDLVTLALSILIVNGLIAMIVGFIPALGVISPYLLNLGELTWVSLGVVIAEIMSALVLADAIRKRI